MEIQVASGVATDLKVLLLAGFVLIGPDTRERRAGGCTVNLGFDTGRGDFACIQRRQTIDQVTVGGTFYQREDLRQNHAQGWRF